MRLQFFTIQLCKKKATAEQDALETDGQILNN